MGRMKKDSIEKQKKTYTKNRDKNEIEKQNLIKKIQEDSKEMLLPTLKTKMLETTDLIVKTLKDKGEENINNIQIMSYIARGSLLETMRGGTLLYTPQEIREGFNLYLDMIDKINQIKSFPPTVESFTAFMGISRVTYNNWLSDPDRKDVMDFIHSYLLGVLAVGGLTGETKEISSMFLQKTMGKVEQQTPIVVEHKKTTDIDAINAQLQALKGNKIIDAEYEEE